MGVCQPGNHPVHRSPCLRILLPSPHPPLIPPWPFLAPSTDRYPAPRRTGKGERHRRACREDSPIHTGPIGDLNFSLFLVAASGFPRFCASSFAYRSLALRCWGVCACGWRRQRRSGLGERSGVLTMADDRGFVGIGWDWRGREDRWLLGGWMKGWVRRVRGKWWRWMDGRLGWNWSLGKVVFAWWSGVEPECGQLNSEWAAKVRGGGSAGKAGRAGKAPPSSFVRSSSSTTEYFLAFRPTESISSTQTGGINGDVSTGSTTFPPLPLRPGTIGQWASESTCLEQLEANVPTRESLVQPLRLRLCPTRFFPLVSLHLPPLHRPSTSHTSITNAGPDRFLPLLRPPHRQGVPRRRGHVPVRVYSMDEAGDG